MTPLTWARRHGACPGSLRYLKGKRLTWATRIGSCGVWREWVCLMLDVDECDDDMPTLRSVVTGDDYLWTEYNQVHRAYLNQPATYAALRAHWEAVVLPAFRKAGVR